VIKPKHKTQSTKLKAQNSKHKSQNSKLKAQNSKPKAQNLKLNTLLCPERPRSVKYIKKTPSSCTGF